MGKRYQETWVRGPTDTPFQRECAARYAPIKAFLEQYKRPFSVFDLGANMGYFSFRIASDFPQATVIAVDDKPDLPKLAAANDLKNVYVIPKRLTASQLGRLADCEAFDVVLALNVLHHMDHWIKPAEFLHRLAAHAIIETPVPGDDQAAHPDRHEGIHRYAWGRGTRIHFDKSHVTPTGRREMFLLDGTATKELMRQTMDVAPGGYKLLTPSDYLPGEMRDAPAMSENIIGLIFDEASIEIARKKSDTVERRDFIPGMNLWNFKLLGGCWPKRGDIVASLERSLIDLGARGIWHDDLRPWNFVLTHDGVRPIDVGWKKWRKEPEEGGLETCLALLDA